MKSRSLYLLLIWTQDQQGETDTRDVEKPFSCSR